MNFSRLVFLPVVALLRGYQKFISPGLTPRCRYHPSCSTYAVTAIQEYGAQGVLMAAWRLLRCNPWSKGGVDYVSPRTKVSIREGG